MNKTGFALLFIIFAASVSAKETLEFPNLLGDMILPETGNLTIHMIPHTHDDIGWLKTVDEYYYGSDKSIAKGGVQYILDSVFSALNMDTTRRFIYVEIGFFKRWWNEQTDSMKNLVKQFVQNGQLEFINGGYCMNDEADVYYEDSIDQMTWGHQFILKNFGVTPTVGWHIDPFGHAAAQAALFAQMGFKAFFFGRIDYQDKTNRLADQGMEMIWIPNTSQGIENAMFTHVNYYLYLNPSGFDFDVLGNDDPIMDDPTLEEYDVDQRANAFMAWFREMEASYKANHLFHTAGMDFEFMAAEMNFKNYDKLFKYIRSQPSYNVNVQYSTPSEYLGLIAPLGITYPQKTDDFFPYADVESGYWTGYFTSRVAVKGLTRQEGRLLQASRRLATQVIWDQSSQFALNNFNQVDQALGALEEALAIGQHHDAVTGTEKQAVTEDYKLHYAVGDNGMKNGFLFPLLEEQIQKDLSLSGIELSMCNLNTSTVFCPATYQTFGQGKSVLVAVFNSATTRQSTIRIKVPNGNVQVTRSSGESLPTDVICANVTDSTDCDLFFTDNFQGLTTSYFYLNPSSYSNEVASQGLSYNSPYKVNANQTFTASSMNSFSFSYCTDGSSNCYSSAFSLNYNYYESYQFLGQQSGAYIFRPSDRTINGAIPYDSPLSGKVFVGKNLIQIQLNGAKTITAMRIYNDMTNGIEVQTFVDSINIADGQGKEIVMVVNVPSINNAHTFYTDSMGMELQKRIVNYRPTWNLQVNQPVSGNYYPVQSTILIQDINSNESLAILPDRAQGGSSINNGEIELMLHRRLVNDDARGVDEPLNELDWDGQGMRQWMTHTFLFTKPGFITTSHRAVQLNNDVANIVALAPTSKTVYKNVFNGEKRLNDDLDARVKVICRPISTTQFVLRFHNMDENESVNVPTQVFANGKFSQHSVVEMSLTYNQKKSDMIAKRVNWNGLDLNNPAYANDDYLNSNQFLLRPFEIRTFMVNFSGAANEVVSEAVSEDWIDTDIISL